MKIDELSPTTTNSNRLSYNGKELDKDLNWYHYGARFYDPAVGRWWVVDPVDEYFSPFIYVGNDPINYIDIGGLGTGRIKDGIVTYENSWWDALFGLDDTWLEWGNGKWHDISDRAVEASAPSMKTELMVHLKDDFGNYVYYTDEYDVPRPLYQATWDRGIVNVSDWFVGGAITNTSIKALGAGLKWTLKSAPKLLESYKYGSKLNKILSKTPNNWQFNKSIKQIYGKNVKLNKLKTIEDLNVYLKATNSFRNTGEVFQNILPGRPDPTILGLLGYKIGQKLGE